MHINIDAFVMKWNLWITLSSSMNFVSELSVTLLIPNNSQLTIHCY